MRKIWCKFSLFLLLLNVILLSCNPTPVQVETHQSSQDSDHQATQNALCMSGQVFLEGKCWVLCSEIQNTCINGFQCESFLGQMVCIHKEQSNPSNSADAGQIDDSFNSDTDTVSEKQDDEQQDNNDSNSTQIPDSEGFTLLWNQDFDPNDCFKNWEKKNVGELKPECIYSEKESQTTVLSIRHPENGSGSNQFAYVWLTNPLEGYESHQELRIEIRYRYRSITGWGTRAFQIGTGNNPDSSENADILNMAHHDLQYILDFFGHHYLKVKDFDFTIIRITYKPQSGDTQFVIYKENGKIADDVNNNEPIDKSGNKPMPKMFMIGSPFIAHEIGWWGGVEVDYVKLLGK